jgi:molybdopterin converting factor small subunit
VISLVFVIPGHLRQFAGGREEIRVRGDARLLADALPLLWAQHPGVRDRVMTEVGEVRQHINIFVDGENTRYSGGLATPVRDGSEIVILPAVSGGGGGLRLRSSAAADALSMRLSEPAAWVLFLPTLLVTAYVAAAVASAR